jgi:paraquat-inducible protein A
MRFVLALIFLAAAFCLYFGLTEPAISVTQFYLFGERYSILDGILAFRDDGQIYLAAFLFAVSVVFPLTKVAISLLVILMGCSGALARGLTGFLATIGKWSMADIFVLSVTVMLLDGRLLTMADMHVGAGLFAAGVILSMIGGQLLAWTVKRRAASEQEPAEEPAA